MIHYIYEESANMLGIALVWEPNAKGLIVVVYNRAILIGAYNEL